MWPTSWGDSSSIYLMYLLCIYRKETWNRSRLYMVYIIDPSTIIIRTVSGRRELLTISLCWAGKRYVLAITQFTLSIYVLNCIQTMCVFFKYQTLDGAALFKLCCEWYMYVILEYDCGRFCWMSFSIEQSFICAV